MRRFFSIFALLLTSLVPFGVPVTHAAGASIYLSAPGSVKVGDTVTVSVMVDTNGQSANSFDVTVSFPSDTLTPVRGATGSVCNLYVSQPDPSSSPSEVECGKSNGFTGTGSFGSFVFTASAAGSARFSASGCQVLANDGNATPITGGCSGTTVNIIAPTPTPAPAAAAATPTPTPKVKASATPSSNQTPKPAETPHTPTPTAEPTAPPVVNLPASTPTPAAAAATQSAKASASAAPVSTQERRTVGQSFSDLFKSLKGIGQIPKNVTGSIALLVVMIPLLLIVLAILFMLYRLYGLEKRRRRTLDRLFEMELSELSALEGKMDLLSEKGAKGKEQYKEEFEKAKANILREIKPDYGKPVDPPPAATT